MLRYDLPLRVEVKLLIFDLTGRRLRTLVDQTQGAGRYAVIWDGRNEQGHPVASGTFLHHLRVVDPVNGGTRTFVKTLKMTLIR
jgi:flagellar hook assembly protein FlgD